MARLSGTPEPPNYSVIFASLDNQAAAEYGHIGPTHLGTCGTPIRLGTREDGGVSITQDP